MATYSSICLENPHGQRNLAGNSPWSCKVRHDLATKPPHSLFATAKSLQQCPTLCDPIDGSPLGSSHPWDSPGKNARVGCHFLLQCMKIKSESEVSQSSPTLSDPMDCSLPGSSVHGFSRQEYWSGVPLPAILKARALYLVHEFGHYYRVNCYLLSTNHCIFSLWLCKSGGLCNNSNVSFKFHFRNI